MPGTPATTTRLAIPRYGTADPAEFPAQANAISDQIDLTVAGFDDGTLAARPAAAAANKGYLYYATDNTTLYYSNGTTWQKVPIGSVGSDLLKPTYGIARPSADTSVGTSLTDVTGCVINVTPTVPSVCRLTYIASVFIDQTSEQCELGVYVDGAGVADGGSIVYLHSSITEGEASCGNSVDFTLTAAAHVIKLRAIADLGNTPIVSQRGTHMKWELIAQ